MSIVPTTMRAKERPIRVTPAVAAVRDVMSNWIGRTLRVQCTSDLKYAEATLSRHEDQLLSISTHAARLLGNLRVELAKPERQS